MLTFPRPVINKLSEYRERVLDAKRNAITYMLYDQDRPRERMIKCGVPPAQQKSGDPCCTEVVAFCESFLLFRGGERPNG